MRTRTRVSDVITVWRAPCTPSGGYFRVPDHFVNFSLKTTGAFGNPFADDAPIDAGGKRHWDYSITGRVSKTKAKGTMQVKVADTDAAGAATDACDTGGSDLEGRHGLTLAAAPKLAPTAGQADPKARCGECGLRRAIPPRVARRQ